MVILLTGHSAAPFSAYQVGAAMGLLQTFHTTGVAAVAIVRAAFSMAFTRKTDARSTIGRILGTAELGRTGAMTGSLLHIAVIGTLSRSITGATDMLSTYGSGSATLAVGIALPGRTVSGKPCAITNHGSRIGHMEIAMACIAGCQLIPGQV